jgi:hypothetical protein
VLRRQAMCRPWQTGEPIDSGRVMLRPLDLVELVIRHPDFSVRLCDGQRTIGATTAAAKGFRAVVGVADLRQVQASVAPAYVAAHEQRSKGLAQRTKAVRNAGERTNHSAMLEASGGP